MESLSYYLGTTVSVELQNLYRAILAYFDRFGVDIHIPMIDSLLATADNRDTTEVLAFLESIVTDQTNSILLAHRIDAYPETVAHAHDYLRALDYYQDIGGDEIAYGILVNSENNMDTWGELVAYACNTMAEDYLSEIRRVDPEALAAIETALTANDSTEDEEYDEGEADEVRLAAVPWVRKRLLAYRNMSSDPSVVVNEIIENNMKLGLPVEVLWASLSDQILDLPEAKWANEILFLALASRMEEEDINNWVSETLTRHSEDPLIIKSAQQILHKRLGTPD